MRVGFSNNIDSFIINELKLKVSENYPQVIFCDEIFDNYPDNAILYSSKEEGIFLPDYVQLLGCKIDSNILKKLKNNNTLVCSISALVSDEFTNIINNFVLSKNLDNSNVKFGIIGLGEIGYNLSNKLLQNNIEVYYNDIAYRKQSYLNPKIRRLTLDLLLSRCDFISIHVRLGPTSKSLISQRELSLIKDNAILINLSEGLLFDQSQKILLDELKLQDRYLTLENFPDRDKILSLHNSDIVNFVLINLDKYINNLPLLSTIDYIDYPYTGDPSFWSSKMI